MDKTDYCPACHERYQESRMPSAMDSRFVVHCGCDDSPVKFTLQMGSATDPYETWLKSRVQKVSDRNDAAAEARTFRMQDGPDLPWSVAKEIYEMYIKLYRNDQSMETMNKRGGFAYSEVSFFTKELKRRGLK